MRLRVPGLTAGKSAVAHPYNETAKLRDQRTPKLQRLVSAAHTKTPRLASVHTKAPRMASAHTKTQRFGDAPPRGRPCRTCGTSGTCSSTGTAYHPTALPTVAPYELPVPERTTRTRTSYRCEVSRVAHRENVAPHLAYGFGLGVSGFGFRVSGFGFQVSGFESRVSGLGCRV